jgi:hypothetical protein
MEVALANVRGGSHPGKVGLHFTTQNAPELCNSPVEVREVGLAADDGTKPVIAAFVRRVMARLT